MRRRYEVFRHTRLAEVSPTEAAQRQRAGAVLLDVREDDECAAGHAPNAVHVPLGQLGEAVGRFHGQRVLTLCRSGRRSAKAARALAATGVDAANVAGGLSRWVTTGLPVVAEDGSPGSVS